MEPPMNFTGRNLIFAMYRSNSRLLKDAIDDFGGRRLGDYFIRMTTANQVYDFKNHTFTTLDKAGATSSTLFGKSGDARTMEQHRITHDFMVHSFARMAATLYPTNQLKPNRSKNI